MKNSQLPVFEFKGGRHAVAGPPGISVAEFPFAARSGLFIEESAHINAEISAYQCCCLCFLAMLLMLFRLSLTAFSLFFLLFLTGFSFSCHGQMKKRNIKFFLKKMRKQRTNLQPSEIIIFQVSKVTTSWGAAFNETVGRCCCEARRPTAVYPLPCRALLPAWPAPASRAHPTTAA